MKQSIERWRQAAHRKAWLKQLATMQGEIAEAASAVLEQAPASMREPFMSAQFLVLDFETTGLDLVNDEVLSLGYTVIENGRVKFRDNRHFIFRYEQNIPGKSVAVHQITETKARSGSAAEEILKTLLVAMQGRVLVAHFSRIEENFIDKLLRQALGLPQKRTRALPAFPLLMVDTLKLAFRQQSRAGVEVHSSRLRLFNARAELKLPRYTAHNALMDAVATAELLLATLSHLYPKRDAVLADLL